MPFSKQQVNFRVILTWSWEYLAAKDFNSACYRCHSTGTGNFVPDRKGLSRRRRNLNMYQRASDKGTYSSSSHFSYNLLYPSESGKRRLCKHRRATNFR